MKPFETFFSGSLIVLVRSLGHKDEHGKHGWEGHITTREGLDWKWDDLYCHGDAMEAAENAIAFASYYSTDNRGDESDIPEWAPSAAIADAIGMECAHTPEDAEALADIEGMHIGDTCMVFSDLNIQTRAFQILE